MCVRERGGEGKEKVKLSHEFIRGDDDDDDEIVVEAMRVDQMD